MIGLFAVRCVAPDGVLPLETGERVRPAPDLIGKGLEGEPPTRVVLPRMRPGALQSSGAMNNCGRNI
jgi:hypothetical protein